MVNFMLHVFYQEEKYENKQSKNEKKKPKRYLNCVLFPTLNYLQQGNKLHKKGSIVKETAKL